MCYNGLLWLIALSFMVQGRRATIEDHSHFSRIFQENRNYRVFLPPDYLVSGKHYPVLYWFHGSGGSSIQDTYKSDFQDYVSNHDLIIVNVDGTTKSGSTWDYGLAFEYKTRTQEGRAALTGMQFSKYIRELISVIDSVYRTIPDRDHRAASGQSMGGLMAPWVVSQNKDLFGSLSMFSPSPDAAMFGPEGREVCFVNSELYRSLKGIPVRITIADGDRYRQYYDEQKAKWDIADLTRFEYRIADYPDHRAVEIPEQFDFHMEEFSKHHPVPIKWSHADPFTDFTVWNYQVKAIRDTAAFTILEKVRPDGMMISSRSFLPDGNFADKEKITVISDSIYKKSEKYIISDYNRTTGKVTTEKLRSDKSGRLKISVTEGGHAIGINAGGRGANLFLLIDPPFEERWCEEGKEYALDFTVVNLGLLPSGKVNIIAKTPSGLITFRNNDLIIPGLDSGEKAQVKGQLMFTVKKSGTLSTGHELLTKISLETSSGDINHDISEIFIYPVPETPVAQTSDLLILDGAARKAEVYDNQTHEITIQELSGGAGNGNSIPEPGETIVLYLRLPQGYGLADTNTFHPALLLNRYEYKYINANDLKYNIKGAEYSGASNLQSVIKIPENTPKNTELVLWLECESYKFTEEGFKRPVQRHKYDYRYVILRINPE